MFRLTLDKAGDRMRRQCRKYKTSKYKNFTLIFISFLVFFINITTVFAASGTVTVELFSAPSSVNPGQLVNVQVRIKYSGDNDGPWQTTDLKLCDDDFSFCDEIKYVSNPLTIFSSNTWYYYTFYSVNLSAKDDGGDGIELYAWGEVDDNDWNLYNPDDSSPIKQVTVRTC